MRWRRIINEWNLKCQPWRDAIGIEEDDGDVPLLDYSRRKPLSWLRQAGAAALIFLAMGGSALAREKQLVPSIPLIPASTLLEGDAFGGEEETKPARMDFASEHVLVFDVANKNLPFVSDIARHRRQISSVLFIGSDGQQRPIIRQYGPFPIFPPSPFWQFFAVQKFVSNFFDNGCGAPDISHCQIHCRQPTGLDRWTAVPDKDICTFNRFSISVRAFQSEPADHNETISKENERPIGNFEISTYKIWGPISLGIFSVVIGGLLIGGDNGFAVLGALLIPGGLGLILYGPFVWLNSARYFVG